MAPTRRGCAIGAALVVSLLAGPPRARAANVPAAGELQRQFDGMVRPFLATYCLACHGHEKPKGQLDLEAFADLRSVVRGIGRWESVLEMLTSREMPPEQARQHPGDQARAQVVEWIRAVRQHEAGRTAGDPGPVLARRLSNAEYDNTVRDLTGVDLRPTREFPVDPANLAGFDNSGESLVMSPALLKKYLDAAQVVAQHLVLAPKGFGFAPHPVVTDTDRDQYAVSRIVRFYERQPTDLARYFQAAWRFQHRAALGKPGASLAACAAEEKVSATYLGVVWSALAQEQDVGPLAKLQGLFRALPAPPRHDAARAGCEKMRDFVNGLREKVALPFDNLELKAVSAGSQPFVLWKNTQRATHRTSFNEAALYVRAPPDPAQVHPETVKAVAALAMSVAHFSFRNIVHDSALPVPFAVHELAATFEPPDPDLAIPDEAARPHYQAAFVRFCQLFPDAFYVSQRGRTSLDQPRDRRDREAKGRFLAAGFHNMFGYFRDDLPLRQWILDEAGRGELDQLWRELDFITLAPLRQHADFIFYERGESRTMRGPAFDFIRAEDKRATSDAMIRRLAEVYVASARESLRKDGGDARAIPVLEEFFTTVSANIRWVERARRAAEPSHREALLAFARRAYRRPLTATERARLLAFYRSSRADGQDHESAIRDGVARVLMSPSFLYRLNAVAGAGVQALDGHALASRLSYFLWVSMPDDELLAHATKGDLGRPLVLAAQVSRMLRDQRARALAVEFGGQWLDFRRFEEHNAVDRDRFPAFDNQLRQAMFEEPVRFILDVVREDRSVLDLLYARHTFVNGALARHYGMPAPPDSDQWVRIDGADRYQRGGILPMAVFLTKNAPGLRTSPVKRGYWVVRRVLGERIPPPPAQVPDLPRDERNMGRLTLREVLAKHRENKACAGCHARFDSYGLALEGYGPVGELRTVDLGGRPVDTHAAFAATKEVPGEKEGEGLAGLRDHVRAHRQDDFLDNLCRKLLSYALGRGLMLSDETTIQTMSTRLAAEGHRFSVLVESIVTSPQFLTRRAGAHSASEVN